MAFEIVKGEEPLTVNSINVLIYGEPGAGKTSLVNTSNKCLTLDFDKGAHRSDFRKDVLVISSWKEINNNMAELIKTFQNYDTIILDTVDTLLDFMGAWIIDVEPKLARIKLQFYGKLKDEFSLFVGKLKTLGKNVIMVAHVKEKDEGDLRIKRPAITGGSYDRVLQTADLVGYLFIKDNKRTLDFNPTDYWIGKNSVKFPQISIPDYSTTPDFCEQLLLKAKTTLNSHSEKQGETLKLINEYVEKINLINNVTDLMAIQNEAAKLKNGVSAQIIVKIDARKNQIITLPYYERISIVRSPEDLHALMNELNSSAQFDAPTKKELWEKMKSRGVELGFDYDKVTKRFSLKPQPVMAPPSANPAPAVQTVAPPVADVPPPVAPVATPVQSFSFD